MSILARLTHYANLLTCYRSGQMEESDWQWFMGDPSFRAWVAKQPKD